MKDAIWSALLIVASASPSTYAAITVYQGNLADFTIAAGVPATTINFDTIAAGTNLAGATVSGVTLSSPSGNWLDVVAGAAICTPPNFSLVTNAATNTLTPTSGLNVLSPGGAALVPGPTLAEQDSLTLDFAVPVRAFGVDVLFQSLDYNAYTSYQIVDTSATVIASGNVDTSYGGNGGAPGGTHFIGFVSDDAATHISRITFIESDSTADYPDANIGFDTLRFTPVPLPLSVVFLGSGGFALLSTRRRP